MIKNPLINVWLRLLCVLIIFFLLAIAIQSSPGGRNPNPVNTERILSRGFSFVLTGHSLLFSKLIGDIFGALWSIGFWCALITTAIQSSKDNMRRWFYRLLILYIVMSLIGMFGTIAMGLIAGAHA